MGACLSAAPSPACPWRPYPGAPRSRGCVPGAQPSRAGPYLVWRPQQPVDPGQLGTEREVLAEREQRRPAGLGEVGAVERVRIVQELHPASQSGHDASLPRGGAGPGICGAADRDAGVTASSGGRGRSSLARGLTGSGRGGRGGGGAGGPPPSSRSPAPPLRRPPCARPAAAETHATRRVEQEREDGSCSIRCPAPSPLAAAAGRRTPRPPAGRPQQRGHRLGRRLHVRPETEGAPAELHPSGLGEPGYGGGAGA